MRKKVEKKKIGKKSLLIIVAGLAIAISACGKKEPQNIIKEVDYKQELEKNTSDTVVNETKGIDSANNGAEEIDSASDSDAMVNTDIARDYSEYKFSEKREELGISVSVDAKVDKSNETKDLYAYEVSRDGITQEMVDKFLDYFAKDTELYDQCNLYYEVMDDEAAIKDYISDKKLHTEKEYVAKYGDDFFLDLKNDKDQMIFAGSADNSKYVSAFNQSCGGCFVLGYNSNHSLKPNYAFFDEVDELRNSDFDLPVGSEVTISEEEARKQADAFVEYLGVEGFELIDSAKGYAMQMESQEGTYGFKYARKLDGVFVNDFDDRFFAYDVDDDDFMFYSEMWLDEAIYVMVDDTGVWSARIDEPKKIKQDTAKKVDIKKFDEAKEIFEQVIFAVANERYKTADISIDKVTLEYSRVNGDSGVDTSKIVPVWHFTGSCSFTTEVENIYDNEDVDFHITINAIDGSVVEDYLSLEYR